jgi:hypothetical protein
VPDCVKHDLPALHVIRLLRQHNADLANSRFHHRPDAHHQPNSKLEAAYHRADKAIQQIVDLLAA